jgi:hypothetical protein
MPPRLHASTRPCPVFSPMSVPHIFDSAAP